MAFGVLILFLLVWPGVTCFGYFWVCGLGGLGFGVFGSWFVVLCAVGWTWWIVSFVTFWLGVGFLVCGLCGFD